MAQSLSKNYLHIVFSTKNREHVLTPAVQLDLHSYMATILKEKNCPAIQIGGTNDHVHMLFVLDKSVTLSDMVRETKANSSRWLKTQSPDLQHFLWQGGFGAFSVSQSDVSSVSNYIRNQEKHHQKLSFQDELRTLLNRYEIDFDEAYIWD
jgi:REP element-mobilizing transposase RayT